MMRLIRKLAAQSYRSLILAVSITSALGGVAYFIGSSPVQAQSVPGISVIPTPAGRARNDLKGFPPHIMRAPGTNVPSFDNALMAGTTCSPLSPANPSSFYPADVTDCGGPVLTNATMHAFFINCAPTFNCWGTVQGQPTPLQFINDYNASTLAQVTNQYVNSNATNRYPQGPYYYYTNYKISNNLVQDIDIFNFLNALINAGASTGLGHLYHIFIQSGIDVCSQAAGGICCAPDGRFAHHFCGYHSFMTYNSGKNFILYTVQPYQDVTGCKVTGGPNEVNDSTATTLSHEMTEAITDPLGNAWRNYYSLSLYGDEIADECQMSNFSFYPTLTINKNQYRIQTEYSNTYHECAAKP
jgi:hypothetical protein